MEDLKIYICTHTDFDCPVNNSAYEIIDVRKLYNYACPLGVLPPFYSELQAYKYMADKKELPKYIGFCHYRRYFEFMDNIPDTSIIDKYGCIVTEPARFNCSVLRQYDRSHNVRDIEIVGQIAKKHFPDLYESMRKMMRGNTMYLSNMFIMRSDHFREMMAVLWEILNRYLNTILLDNITAHITLNCKRYHIGKPGRYGTVDYQYRIGGYLGERIISAWIMQHFPNAYTFKTILTSKPLK